MPESVEQQVRGLLAGDRVADQHRHDVRRARHHRQAGGGEPRFSVARALLVALAQLVMLACRWRTLASAPPVIAGASEVVKMKPGAIERTASISAAEPAM